MIAPPDLPLDQSQITRKAGRGFFWNFLTYGLGKLVVLITTSILARLLTKDEFGQVAIAVVAINYLSVIKDLGFGLALIQRRDDINRAADVVFTLNVIIGFVLSLIIIPLAPWFALYFNDPLVTSLLRWLGASFAINALGAVHNIWLMRDLDYRRRFIPSMGNTLIKGVVSIGMAYAGFGVWSLVFGQIAGAVGSVILVWIIFPWRPRISFDLKITRELMKFGVSVTVGDSLGVFIDNVDYIIVGKLFGLAELSVYTLAYRLPEMLLIGNLWVLNGITFPAFSSIQDKPAEMRQGVLAAIRLIQLIAVPISVGLFIAADPIVRVVFGDQWLEAIPVLRVLAVYAWVYSLGFHIGDVYKAIGRPDINLKLDLLTIFIVVPALLIGSRFGLIGIAWGHLIAVLIQRAITLALATRFVKIKIVDIIKELTPAFTGALVMVLFTSAAVFLTSNLNSFIQLILVVIVGMVSYLTVMWWLERDNLLGILRIFRPAANPNPGQTGN